MIARVRALPFLTVLALVFSATYVRAGFVTYTDVDAFRAAAGNVNEIDFELLPDGSPSVDETFITPEFNYTDQGVTFSSPFPELFVAGSPGIFELGAHFPDTSGRNWIIADLVTPAWAVGIFFPGGTTLSIFDVNQDLIGSEHLLVGGGSSSVSYRTSRSPGRSRTEARPPK